MRAVHLVETLTASLQLFVHPAELFQQLPRLADPICRR